jgi:hypothetical protein
LVNRTAEGFRMRQFEAEDGRTWTARTDPASARRSDLLTNVGWEAIVFDATTGATEQRLVFRPAGWLPTASLAELREALDEADAIRTTWGPAPRET